MDIALNIKGDAAGAVSALKAVTSATEDVGTATEGLEGQWKKLEETEKSQAAQLANVKAGFAAVGAAAVKLGIDAVKAFAEAERVSMQLARVAGDLTSAFEAQADALESQLAVDGEVIKQQQTMLLAWGAAPSVIEPTIRAIEDYAAFTGKDAVTATQEIIKAVNTGGERLKALGYEFELTGDKAKDLGIITDALAAKVGGAAGVNAASLSGRITAAELAMENLKKAFGGVIAAMESKLGILDKVATAMNRIARGITGSAGAVATLGAMTPAGLIASALGFGPGGAEPTAPDITAGADVKSSSVGISGGVGLVDQEKTKAVKKHGDDMAKIQEDVLAADAKRNADWREAELRAQDEFAKQSIDAEKKRVDEDKKDRLEVQEWLEKMSLESKTKEREALEKQAKSERDALEKSTKETIERVKEKEKQAKQAGDAIGGALVNALADQLSKLAQGGEFDAATFIGDILAVAISAAATVIGSAFGMPALGAAVGNLAATGVRLGAGAMSASAKRARTQKQYHEGGWVGDEADIPRHHSGAWIGTDEQRAILQTGERVLSRDEVRGMGGKTGVDAMARGSSRGSVVVNIQAIDSRSAAESFESDLGRGLRRALRTGRGDMGSLLGAGAR